MRLPVVLLLALLVAAAATGGSNRGDVIVVLAIRLVAALCIAAAIVRMPGDRLSAVKIPLAILLLLMAWIVIQVIPLPPAIWTSLPGRERFAEPATLLGVAQPWMSISIAPVRTLNSLLAVLVPLAGLLVVAWLPRRSVTAQLSLLLALGIGSGILALLQVMGSSQSPLYLYEVSQKGGAVGFFANRNHQAALLTCMFPMLIAGGMHYFRAGARASVVILIAATIGLFLIALIFITGSRAGLALALVSILASTLLLLPVLRRAKISRKGILLVGGVGLVVAAGLGTATALSSRSLSFQRLSQTEISEEKRLQAVAPISSMIGQNFPTGTGFGTFDPAFRAIEPDFLLNRTYLNHAHSEPLEFVSDGGLPAALLLLAFIVWWGATTISIWFGQAQNELAKAATIATGLLMLASFVDYPLRTPLASLVFAMMVAWMAVCRTAAPEHASIDRRSTRTGRRSGASRQGR